MSIPTEEQILSFEEKAKIGQTSPGFFAPQIPAQEPSQEPLMITSKDGEKIVRDAEKRLKELQGEFEKIKTQAEPLLKSQETPITKEDVSKAVEEATKKILDMEIGIPSPEKIAIIAETPEIKTLRTELEKSKTEINDYKTQLNQFTITDSELQATIQNINNTFDIRIKQMEDINRRNEAALTMRGLRTGAARYTASFAGIISAEEKDSIARIGELEAQKQSAILTAKQAQKEQNWKVFTQQVKMAKDTYNDKIKELTKLQEVQQKKQEEINKQQKETALNDSVFNLIGSGNKTTEGIYQSLRKQGIKTTAEEVAKIFNSFVPKPSKDTSKNTFEFSKNDIGKLISAGFIGDDAQVLQDGFNKYGLYSPIPELENKSIADSLTSKQLKTVKEILYPIPTSQKVINAGIENNFSDMSNGLRVARMAFGSGRSLSDKDRDFGVELYNKGKTEGLNVYEIVDKIFGFVIADPQDKPLAEGLRNTLLSVDGQKGMSDYDLEGLARLINSGNDIEAVGKVEDIGIKKIKERKTDAMLESDVSYIQEKFDDITVLLGEGWIDDVGAFGEGKMRDWLNRKVGYGGQATIIKAKVTNIIADMVNRRVGSAITEEEWKRLVAPNVPAIDESATAFKQKLDELYGDVLERYNSQRKSVGLPELKKEHIKTPELRIELYKGKNETDDLLDSIPVGASGEYSEDIWNNL